MNNDLKYWVAFSKIENIGPQKMKLLKSYFPNMEAAWQASATEYQAAGLYPCDIHTITAAKKQIDPDCEYDNLTKHNIHVITINHKAYPALLKEIYAPPPLLYIRGSLTALPAVAIAVVGTRKTTRYGRTATSAIVRAISHAGVPIVSGLALGIDALAHQTALENGNQTYAVLGCGLDIIYPATNRRLAENIISHGGALISEYPPGTQPLKQHFPARNRIISGLCKGVVVVEGSQKSGALITARFALEQNREVFAVPGNINCATAQGPNNLIKMGAHVVTEANDILSVLDLAVVHQQEQNKKMLPRSEEEKTISQVLASEPKHIDEIVRQCKLDTSIINAHLTMMEMKGIVKHIGGQYYAFN